MDNNCEFIMSLLRLAIKYDIQDDLRWFEDKQKIVKCFIVCSDMFFWGSGDGEDVTGENMDVLQESIDDCKAIDADFGYIYGSLLFCSRIRKTRPQGAAYPPNRKLWPLFNACGPERKVGLGNPYNPGEYQSHPKSVDSLKNEVKQ